MGKDIIEIKVKKNDIFYLLYINGKEMPELYTEREIKEAFARFINIWSNKT